MIEKEWPSMTLVSLSKSVRKSAGLFTQVAISATSFFNSMFAAKGLDLRNFGVFATGLAMVALLSSLLRSVTTDAWLALGRSNSLPDVKLFRQDLNTYACLTVMFLLIPTVLFFLLGSSHLFVFVLLCCLVAVVGTWTDSQIWLALDQRKESTAVTATTGGLFVQLCLLGVTTRGIAIVDSPADFLILLVISQFVTGAMAAGDWGANSLGASTRRFVISFVRTRYLLLESLVAAGSSQIALLMVATVANVEQVGALRAAGLLLAPVGLITQSLPRMLVIGYRRRSTEQPHALRDGGKLFICVSFFGLMMSLLPVRFLQEFLGASASPAKSSVFPLSIYSACVLMVVPVWASMRTSGKFKKLYRLRMISALPVLILPPLIAKLSLAQSGAALGMGVAGCLTSAIWILALRHDHYRKEN